MRKGEQTRVHILDRGMLYSSQQGLADLSIGSMAKICGLSRTGVMSHFENKADMQVAILRYAENQFIERVIRPSRDEDAREQLEKLVFYWVDWTQPVFAEQKTGCPFVKALVDYEHREQTPVKSMVCNQHSRLLSYLADLVSQGQAQQRLSAESPARDIAYELYSLYVGTAIASAIQKDGKQKLLQRTLQRHTLR